jgi:hypothetical protein
MTYEERIDLIRETHIIFLKKKRKKPDKPLLAADFHYTDASKYAKKYYGETYRETTRFDNDWD